MSCGQKLSLPLGRGNDGDAPGVNPLLGSFIEGSHVVINVDSVGL